MKVKLIDTEGKVHEVEQVGQIPPVFIRVYIDKNFPNPFIQAILTTEDGHDLILDLDSRISTKEKDELRITLKLK